MSTLGINARITIHASLGVPAVPLCVVAFDKVGAYGTSKQKVVEEYVFPVVTLQSRVDEVFEARVGHVPDEDERAATVDGMIELGWKYIGRETTISPVTATGESGFEVWAHWDSNLGDMYEIWGYCSVEKAQMLSADLRAEVLRRYPETRFTRVDLIS